MLEACTVSLKGNVLLGMQVLEGWEGSWKGQGKIKSRKVYY